MGTRNKKLPFILLVAFGLTACLPALGYASSHPVTLPPRLERRLVEVAQKMVDGRFSIGDAKVTVTKIGHCSVKGKHEIDGTIYARASISGYEHTKEVHGPMSVVSHNGNLGLLLSKTFMGRVSYARQWVIVRAAFQDAKRSQSANAQPAAQPAQDVVPRHTSQTNLLDEALIVFNDIGNTADKYQFYITIFVILGLINGLVARKKGYSFWEEFVFGGLFFIIAFPLLLMRKTNYEGLHKQKLAGGMKECLFCAEAIKKNAKLCRYCGKEQVKPTS